MTIRNDATRLRIDSKEKRRSRAVVSRQGQVLLDTDFDQQTQALLGRIETETADTFDSAGKLVYPADEPSFQITAVGAAANLDIGPGHAYLDGWLLENPTSAKLGTQPHPRSGDVVTPPAIIAIKALVRHVDPVEDIALADVALGDAKASGRALNDWQVFPLNVAGAFDCSTAADKPEWIALAAPSTGTMSVIKQAAGPSTDPCSLSPGGGYTRLENLLYRIEVEGGTNKAGFPVVDGPRFGLNGLKVKLSRRNASLMARITLVSGSEMTVEPASLDARAWFAPGAFAEIVGVHDDVDPRAALLNQRVFRIAQATDDKVVLEATAAQVGATGAVADGKWFLRLWDAFPDQAGVATIVAAAATSQVIDIGDGLSIRFHNGAAATFRRGDYWTFAARADGSVAWPETGGTPDPMTPHGPETRYAVLATVFGSATPVVENCSVPAFSLTDKFLFYRGGDGQSVFASAAAPPFVPLPQKLRVAVMRGETPVKGAVVRWSPPTGAPDSRIGGVLCTAASPRVSMTDANGLVEVEWAIDRAQPLAAHRVEATLALAPGKDLLNRIQFNALFETGAHTAYVPGQCVHLNGIDNVQDALDVLCAKIDAEPPVLTLSEIRLIPANGQPIDMIDNKEIILNAREVAYDSFVGGISFGFDGGAPDIKIEPFDPVVEIELDLPYPSCDPERIYWAMASETPNPGAGSKRVQGPFGFQRVRLDGTVELLKKRTGFEDGLIWTPSPQAQAFLLTAPAHRFGQKITQPNDTALKSVGWTNQPAFERVLCRLRLRAPMIWVGKTGVRAYLNAEHLGFTGSFTKRELQVGKCDPQAAADLDMFIYLTLRDVRPVRPVREEVVIAAPPVTGKP
jgi:hypothetical protein